MPSHCSTQVFLVFVTLSSLYDSGVYFLFRNLAIGLQIVLYDFVWEVALATDQLVQLFLDVVSANPED